MSDPMSDPMSYLSGIGGVLSSIFPFIGDKSRQQYNYQVMLNKQQQEYARENREAELYNQYRYQYNLPSLQKEGLRSAGYSVAGVENGSVSSANTPGTASPSAGAAPSGAADVTAALGVANMIQNLSLVKAQTEKTQAEAHGQIIKNDVDSDSAIFDKIHRRSIATLSSLQSNNYFLYGGKREEAEAELSSIRKDIAACEYLFKKPELQLDYLTQKQTLDNLRESLELMKKEGFKVTAELDQVKALTRSVESQIRQTDEVTEGVKIDNEFKRRTLDDRVDITRNQKVRAILDSYPRSVREAGYALLLNPELYPSLIKDMSPDEIRDLQELNKKLLDVNDLGELISPWK